MPHQDVDLPSAPIDLAEYRQHRTARRSLAPPLTSDERLDAELVERIVHVIAEEVVRLELYIDQQVATVRAEGNGGCAPTRLPGTALETLRAGVVNEIVDDLLVVLAEEFDIMEQQLRADLAQSVLPSRN